MYLSPGLAGALATWVVMLALAALLAWRSPAVLRLPARTMAGFGAAAPGAFLGCAGWPTDVGYPGRHQSPDAGGAVSGGWLPPAFAWNPDVPAAYHHGLDLLVGLSGTAVWAGSRAHDRDNRDMDVDQSCADSGKCAPLAWRLDGRAGAKRAADEQRPLDPGVGRTARHCSGARSGGAAGSRDPFIVRRRLLAFDRVAVVVR